MAWIEDFLVNYWVNKRNNSKICCGMQNVLSWFRALKSRALSVRLAQTNSVLHFHAKVKYFSPLKVSYLFGWICDSKLLLSLSTYKSNYSSKHNLLLQLFLCTHVTHFAIRLVGGDRPKSIAKWTPKIKDDQTKKASFGVIYVPVWSCQCNWSTRNWEFLKKTGSWFKQYKCKLQDLL